MQYMDIYINSEAEVVATDCVAEDLLLAYIGEPIAFAADFDDEFEY